MPAGARRGRAKKSSSPAADTQSGEKVNIINAAAPDAPTTRRSSRAAASRARAQILFGSSSTTEGLLGTAAVQLPHNVVIKPDPDADDAAAVPEAAVQPIAVHRTLQPSPEASTPPEPSETRHLTAANPFQLNDPAVAVTSQIHPSDPQSEFAPPGFEADTVQNGTSLASQNDASPSYVGPDEKLISAVDLPTQHCPGEGTELHDTGTAQKGKGRAKPKSKSKAKAKEKQQSVDQDHVGQSVDLTAVANGVQGAEGAGIPGDGAVGGEGANAQNCSVVVAGVRIKQEEDGGPQDGGSTGVPQQASTAPVSSTSQQKGLNARQLRRLLLLSSSDALPAVAGGPSPTSHSTSSALPSLSPSITTPQATSPAVNTAAVVSTSPKGSLPSAPATTPTAVRTATDVSPAPQGSLPSRAVTIDGLDTTDASPSASHGRLTGSGRATSASDGDVTGSGRTTSASDGGVTPGLSLPPRPRRNPSFTSKGTETAGDAGPSGSSQRPARKKVTWQLPNKDADSSGLESQDDDVQYNDCYVKTEDEDIVIVLDSDDDGKEGVAQPPVVPVVPPPAAAPDVLQTPAASSRGSAVDKGKAKQGAARPVRRRGRKQVAEDEEGEQEHQEDEEDDKDEEGYDLEDVSDDEGERGGRGMFHHGPVARDFAGLELKPDHVNRPLWVTPDRRIFLETYSPMYKQAYDFLIAIAEPVCRPENVHEYQLTAHSLYAAVSIGLETHTIVSVLNLLSKVKLPPDTEQFIQGSTQNYGKVRLVLKRNRFYVESHDPRILKRLLEDPVIAKAKVGGPDQNETFLVSKALRERAGADIARRVREAEEDLERERAKERERAEAEAAQDGEQGREQGGQAAAGEDAQQDAEREKGQEEEEMVYEELHEEPEELEEEVHAFEVEADQVEHVKQRCLPGGLNYPMLEEYDFRNDVVNADLGADLKPHVKLRPYQQKSLSKMFGNGRARSGIIVLPCGAGKSLVGVAAALRVRKSCLCLCTSSVSVDQWQNQFKMWSSLQDHQIARFTSQNKETFTGDAGVLITTFTMISYSGKRSDESERVMKEVREREWGLMLLDEVHVVPADIFRRVISIVKAHCKLGLTATLVREDHKIGDLDFLIGPKLYEANWLDLTRAGHIAKVQCAEVWCPMTKEFFREYLKPQNAPKKQLLYIMNPNKFMACQFLIEFHERVRGDKIIVFSDNIFALKEYAMRFRKPFIYGPTTHAERTRILHAFKHSPDVNTVFLSKVGDIALDIPEANVLIQISSHAGSRRQEAQRLGRILRAKRGKPGSGKEEEFNAFFYTLLSKDTQEMYYSSKRQQFLVDQGYSFKVVTNLLDAARASEMPMHCSSYDEQLNLLARVLSTNEDEAGVEAVDDEKEDTTQKSGTAIRRTKGSMSALSGAEGMMYMEYKTGDKRPAAHLGYKSNVAKKMAKNLINKQ